MENEKIDAFWGLGATYAVHIRLIGKLVVDFLLVIIELFSLGAFDLSQFMRLTDGETDGWMDAYNNTSLTQLQCGKIVVNALDI